MISLDLLGPPDLRVPDPAPLARLLAQPKRFALLAAGKPGEALALCRGEFLSGFLLGDSAAFHQWLDEERERIRRRAVDAAWTLAAAGQAGDSFAASRWVRWALLQTPSDEAALRHGMRLLATLGDRGGALRVHAEFVQRPAKDSEAEPSPATQVLLASIRQGA